MFLATLLLLWGLLSSAGLWPDYLLPGPRSVAESIGGLVTSGRLGAAVFARWGGWRRAT
jgi:ABC-type nitrate/sulfonate/bicarbonate transport system permease component